MTRRNYTIVAFVAAVLLSPRCGVEACGPDFEPDVFVNAATPDDHALFADGQLGILQSGFDSSDYAVAYRYLNGGKLSSDELRVYAPLTVPPKFDEKWWRSATSEQKQAAQKEELEEEQGRRAAQPINRWLAERAKYAPTSEPAAQNPPIPTNWQGNVVIDDNYLNCPDAAFENATLTIAKRAQSWGKESKVLADWIRGQDTVFSNCAGKSAAMPAIASFDSPALLRADRAYQTASANFYARNFDDAARQFAAIAADRDSPWNAWGAYLEARATVRKAFAMGKASDPWSGELATFDMETMRRAQKILENLLALPHPIPSRSAIESELSFIRIRTEPEKRASEIVTALAGPAPDANFGQDLQDLNFLLIKHVKVGGPAPLLEWIAAWRGSGTAATAYARWQQSHAQPWLVIAMVKSAPSDPFVPELLAEAKKIAPHTPAYDSVFYHRVRLLIGINRTDEARALLDAALPALRKQKPSSNLNALLGERMAVARSFSEFLEFAPRPTLSTGSQGDWDLHGQCNERAHASDRGAACPEAELPVEFDLDAAQILNRKTPLPLLIEAASSPKLPQNLRESIAIMAWTRSVLLDDSKSSAALVPLLPKAVRDTAGSSIGFPADLAILRNPGIRPYLESGVPRVASFSYFDELRDNWWCKRWDEQQGYGDHTADSIPRPSFLPADRIAVAESQYVQLQELPDSAAVIGQRVIDYAKAHHEDPLVPEALALTVRATHYACQTYDYSSGGSPRSKYTPTSKAAFELLHNRYPKSPWTAKTRYYY
jgi:hypothetical protein